MREEGAQVTSLRGVTSSPVSPPTVAPEPPELKNFLNMLWNLLLQSVLEPFFDPILTHPVREADS